MAEDYYEVTPIKIIYKCDNDECFEVEVEFTGAVLMSSPPKYVHTCPACDKEHTLGKKYPLMDFI